MRVRTTICMTLVLACGAVGGALASTTYDIKANWSGKNNPNGPWTFLQGSTLLPADSDWTPLSTTDSAYNPIAGHIAQPAFAPGNNTGNFLPAFFKAAVTPATVGFGWRKGDIVLHTTDSYNGVGEGDASAVFTAPTAGTVTISGYVFNARNLGRPQAWQVLVNGVNQASGALPGDGSITRATKTRIKPFTITLAAGDKVVLAINEAGGAAGPGDFVGLDLKIVYP